MVQLWEMRQDLEHSDISSACRLLREDIEQITKNMCLGFGYELVRVP